MRARREREKVAVLGGGPAAVTAAFQLTATPELRERFDVTVYQLGWRLGGKCANGRNLQADRGKRIEEHGLHVWFGFYDNAFSMMRSAYEELERPTTHPLPTIEHAFKGCDEVVLYDRQGDGWLDYSIHFPPNDKSPGGAHDLPDFWQIASQMCEWAIERLHELSVQQPAALRPVAHHRALTPGWFADVAGAAGVGAGINDLRGGEQLLHLAHHVARTSRLVGSPQVPRIPLPSLPGLGLCGHASPEALLATLLTRFRDWLWDNVVSDHCEQDPHLRLFFTAFDTFASATAGIVEDGVLSKGWDAINDLELCTWLEKHGAKRVTLGATAQERSPLLRAIYDVAFAYPHGIIKNADVAAGTAMNDLLRLVFAYRGSVLYKMQAGMGEAVLTPIYEVLRKRGVKFEFFHAVTKLRLSADGTHVDEIDVVPQVQLEQESYEPLISRDPAEAPECWPNEPLWDQLQQGDELRRRGIDFEQDLNPLGRDAETLRRRADFDSVVLGIPIGALGPICGELGERHGRFADMLKFAATVRTQAFQLWLASTPEELGWQHGPGSVAGCYVEPLDTWCDMTHLLDREAWPAEAGVRGLLYFCGVLDDRPSEDHEAARERVKENAREFLEEYVGTLLPLALKRGSFDWSVLADPEPTRTGPARLDAQYWRANTAPSELYALTPAKSVRYRLAADESGVTNLMLAGDWTKNGVDGGCVEAAVTSGMQAARALIEDHVPVTGESPTWLTDRSAAKGGCLGRLFAGGGSGPPKPAPAAGGPPGSRTLGPYVEFGGRVSAPPAFISREGRFQGVLLRGDAGRIAGLCERMLNGPAGGTVTYRPLLGSYVLLMSGSFGYVASTAPGFERWGSVRETQLSLWVPVQAGHGKGSGFEPERLCMSVPYIFVDNPMSYAGGREDYGYPKSMGIFEPSIAVGDQVVVQAYGGDFAPGNKAGWHPVLELARLGAGGSPAPAPATALASDLEAVRGWAADLARELGRDVPIVGDVSFLSDVVKALLRKQVRQVFLKQFRDSALAGAACYQAVVEAPIQITSASLRPSLHAWELTVHPLDSHPITEELGVGTQTTRFAFELDMEMIAEPGVVVAP